MGIYVDILPLLPVLPDVATVLGIEPQAVLGWGLRVFLFVVAGLLNGILGRLANERVWDPLRALWRGRPPEDTEEVRERKSELNREIGRLEGRLEAEEIARQREREESERRDARYKAELEEERRPWWRKLLGG